MAGTYCRLSRFDAFPRWIGRGEFGEPLPFLPLGQLPMLAEAPFREVFKVYTGRHKLQKPPENEPTRYPILSDRFSGLGIDDPLGNPLLRPSGLFGLQKQTRLSLIPERIGDVPATVRASEADAG